MVRTLLIAVALVAALGRAAAASEPDPQSTAKKPGDPTGVYLCEGVNPDGHRYRGIVQIAAVDDNFLVRWTLADDVEVTGVGILRNDTLSVSYFGGTPAVVVYIEHGERTGRANPQFCLAPAEFSGGSALIPKQGIRPHFAAEHQVEVAVIVQVVDGQTGAVGLIHPHYAIGGGGEVVKLVGHKAAAAERRSLQRRAGDGYFRIGCE